VATSPDCMRYAALLGLPRTVRKNIMSRSVRTSALVQLARHRISSRITLPGESTGEAKFRRAKILSFHDPGTQAACVLESLPSFPCTTASTPAACRRRLGHGLSAPRTMDTLGHGGTEGDPDATPWAMETDGARRCRLPSHPRFRCGVTRARALKMTSCSVSSLRASGSDFMADLLLALWCAKHHPHHFPTTCS